MSQRWISGNKFTLLENGEEYYPRVFDVIATAQREVLLETFILYEDKVGKALHAALLKAAQRGAHIDITIDGWGSPDLSKEFIDSLTSAGVHLHVFDQAPKPFTRLNYFRRMHRKLVVVDGVRAFIGGINYSADHLGDYGPEAKQDYAVEIEGPIVAKIHHFMHQALVQGKSKRSWFQRPASVRPVHAPPAAGQADAIFIHRDNRQHTQDIERQYRLAIRLARRRIIIANAYFFPGFRFLRDLRKAARRGVEVTLILQGKPDMLIVQKAASLLYYDLLRSGVKIHEYCKRPFHGKVAVIDDEWSTVGSSNLDPLSLSLNLEANVIIRDRQFNQQLSDNLHGLIQQSCKKIEADSLQESYWWRRTRSVFLFHFLRRFPAWAGWLPAHAPKLASFRSGPAEEGANPINETACS